MSHIKIDPGALAGAAGAGNHVAGRQQDFHTTLRSARQAEALGGLQRQRRIERLCRRGPRVVAELLDEIARHHGIAADVDRRLARYCEIDPAILAALGGDRFPAAPIRAVAP